MNPAPRPLLRLLVPLLACVASAGCYNPRKSDCFVWDVAAFPTRPAPEVVALYLPNRIFDVLDLVHFGAAVGPALGVEVQATRALRYEWARGATLGLGWFGRAGEWRQASVYARDTFGLEDSTDDLDLAWHVPYWDVSLQLHVLVGQVYVGVAPFDELVDLVVGLTTFDLKGDDW